MNSLTDLLRQLQSNPQYQLDDFDNEDLSVPDGMNMNPQNISRTIQEKLGAIQPSNGGAVQQALSSRFEPELADYGKAAVSTLVGGKPIAAQDISDIRMSEYMDRLSKIKQAKAGGMGGATGELVQRYMDSTGADFPQALQAVQTGYRQGYTLDAEGNAVVIPGIPQAKGAIKYAENLGGSRGTQQGEVEYVGQKKMAADLAATTAEARSDLPRIVTNAQNASKTIQDILAAPGLEGNLGVKGQFPNFPGGDAANAKSLMDKLAGSTFLEAFNTLKGAGQITNIEGEKGTNAIATLQTTQSPEAYKLALMDLQNVINNGVLRAQNAAQGNFNAEYNVPPISEDSLEGPTITPSSRQPNMTQPKQRLKYNPATGEFE